MLENLLISLLGISVTTSVVILLLKLWSGVFNKTYGAKWKYWIWLVLAVRLVIPFNFSFLPPPVSINVPNAPIHTFANTVPAQKNTNMPSLQVEQNSVKQDMTTPFAPSVQANPVTLTNVLARIWIFGCMVFLFYQLIGYCLFKKKVVRWGKKSEDLRIINILHHVMGEMGLKKEITIFINRTIPSPLMTGFMKPLLVLPNDNYSDTDLNFILRHELIHYKRHDIWYKLFLIFVNALHWFNPFIYLLFHEASIDLELSCDDEVIKGLSKNERRAYSETILALISEQKAQKAPLSTYFYGRRKTMKNRFKNIFNTKKKRSGLLVLLAVILLIGTSGSLFACSADVKENKFLSNLGYTKTLVNDILEHKTEFSQDNEQIQQIVPALPLPSYRKYISFSLQTEPSKEIRIAYEFDDHYDRGGNGLDPFYETVEENNALLLFASVNGLEKVTFLSYESNDSHELNRTDSYTVYDLAARFGDVIPSNMNFTALYTALGTNIHLSEWYFAHYSRIYLGMNPERVSYRNGEPNEIIQRPDGSTVWIYNEFNKIYHETPAEESEIIDPGYTAIYYFDSKQSEKNDNLFGLYATRFIHADNDGKSYDNITEIFGYPSITKNLGGGRQYIAYRLIAEHNNVNAYFVFYNDAVIEEGVMYGDDYSALTLEK